MYGMCFSEKSSWAFDGHLEEKVHLGVAESYGRAWHVGDVIGVFLDLADRTISEAVCKQNFLIFFAILIIFGYTHLCTYRRSIFGTCAGLLFCTLVIVLKQVLL